MTSSIPSLLTTLSRHQFYPLNSSSSLPIVTLIIASLSSVRDIASAYPTLACFQCLIKSITLLTRMSMLL